MNKPDLKSLKNNPEQLQKAVEGVDPAAMRQVQQAVQRYEGKDEESLMEELAGVAAQERLRGNLSDERMDSIVNMIAPMLSAEQQQKMRAITEQLKGNL